MGTVLLVLVVVLVVAALIFGVVSLLTGEDPGLGAAEPDGRAAPLPNNRSLTEDDIKTVRFDVTWRGYRMSQVDRILRRTAYDIGYKNEMIAVLEAEVIALREGRAEDADLLRKAREAAANTNPTPAPTYSTSVLAAGWVDPEDELASGGLMVADGGPAEVDDEAVDDEAAEEELDVPAEDVLDPTAPGRLAYRANGQPTTNGHGPAADESLEEAAAEPTDVDADTDIDTDADTDTDNEDEDEDEDEDARDASDTPSARA